MRGRSITLDEEKSLREKHMRTGEKWTAEDYAAVRSLRFEGLTIRSIADVMRTSTRQVQDILKGKLK